MSLLSYDEGGKNKQWRENSSLVNSVGKTGQLHVEELDWTTFSYIHKNKLKMHQQFIYLFIYLNL